MPHKRCTIHSSGIPADAALSIRVTHGAERVSAQTAFTVQTADLRLRAGLGHPLKERPGQTDRNKYVDFNRAVLLYMRVISVLQGSVSAAESTTYEKYS